MSYNIFGERVMVKSLLEKKTITKTEEFKGIVEVIAVGHKFDQSFPLSVGDKLLVTGTQNIHGEEYVLPSQIVRKL